jgi:hypothetical protein
MKEFTKRHLSVSHRTPGNTILATATFFNGHRAGEFYDNYERVVQAYKYGTECRHQNCH